MGEYINQNIPKSLYKFASFDADKHYEELIRDNRLYFAHPEELNDPFECKIAPDFSLWTEDLWLEVFKKLATEEEALYGDSYFSEVIKQDISYMLDSPKRHIESFQKMFNSLLGICCFSEERNNLLMWSHYAKGHRGICLEFDVSMLRNHFLSYLRYKQTIFLMPIVYESEYPSLKPPLNNIDEWGIPIYTTKSKNWNYEKEWRLIYLYGGKEKPKYKDNMLKSIYIGVGCKEPEEKKIRELIKDKSPKPKLYKGRTADFKFEIVFDEIPNT